MSLSPREQRILAGIEQDLGQKDPALAKTFARTRLPSSAARRKVVRWFPLSLVRHRNAITWRHRPGRQPVRHPE